jgi:hypothetical protein
MERILFLMITCLATISLNAQTFEWANKLGTSTAERVYSVTTDNAGNVYTTGYFQNTVDFDPGTGVFNLTSNGGYDIFVTKLNAAGNLVWAKNMGGSANDVGESVTIDYLGNIFITGYFQSTADMDPGSGTTNLISSGSYDIFITKLDASGNFDWAKRMGGSGVDIGYSVVVDTVGNIYSTGYFRSTADFDPGSGIYNLTAEGIRDIFISKLDSAGDFVWTKKIGRSGYNAGRTIHLDNFGDIYVSGDFQDSADFDSGVDSLYLWSEGLFDVFVCKLDTAGNLKWAKGWGSTDTDFSSSLTTDSVGNVYTTGYFKGTVDFDPNIGVFNLASAGSRDVFVSKLDSSGAFSWAKQIGGIGDDRGFSIAKDAQGNLYTTGMFENTADFNPGTGIFNLTSNGDLDCFVSKLDATGNFVWAIQTGGVDDDAGYSIAVDPSSNVYTAGNFESTVDFDPSSTSYNLTSAGSYDVFIQKLSQCPSASSTDTIIACNSYTWIDGNTYTQSTNSSIFTISGGAASGCDSVITLNLTINSNATSIDTITACSTYTWIDGMTYTVSTNMPTFTFIGAASNTCDSVVTLNLSINNSTSGIDTITACSSYTWVDGVTYTSSTNTPIFNITGGAANGCDSLSTLNLTINNHAIGIDTITACSSYTWIDGMTYTSSTNTPTFTVTGGATNGCDSLATLNLTINNGTIGIDTITACSSYSWIDGMTYTSSTNTPTFTVTGGAANGCDSLTTLNLTINNSTIGIDTITACSSYTWIDGMTYTSSTNTPTFTFTGGATNGCDSLVTLNLTINTVNSSVTQTGTLLTADESGAIYQWLNCPGMTPINGATNQTYMANANGDYAVIITNNGCSDTSACYSVIGVGIIDNDFGNELLLFPNPTDGDFSIDLGQIYQTVTITITDVSGKLIQSNTYRKSQLLNLKLNDPAGVYLLIIASENKRAVIRLLKK